MPSGASKMSGGVRQGNTELGDGIKAWGDRMYKQLHEGSLNEIRNTGDFSYLTSPWQALKIGTAEALDKFTQGGDMNASENRDRWYDQAQKDNLNVWRKMQINKPLP